MYSISGDFIYICYMDIMLSIQSDIVLRTWLWSLLINFIIEYTAKVLFSIETVKYSSV